jgi:hydrogenase maturation factor
MDRFGDSALVHAATQVQRLSAEDSPERWRLWLSMVDAIQESMRYREEPDRWRPRP